MAATSGDSAESVTLAHANKLDSKSDRGRTLRAWPRITLVKSVVEGA